MEPVTIDSPIQIAVEGRDALEIFSHLCKTFRPDAHCQIQNFGGVNEFRAFIKALVLTPGFNTAVTSLLIIRDAENDAKAAFQSISNSLAAAGLQAPLECGTFSNASPRVGVFILPDGSSPGMLENLLLSSVSDDPSIACIDSFFDCLAEKGIPTPLNSTKARFQAFLASRQRHMRNPGQAVKHGFIPLETAAFLPLKEFIQSA